MTSDELRERVARKLCQEKCAFYGEPPCWGLDPSEYVIEPWNPDTCDEPGCGALADAAIAVVLEEAAAVAETNHHPHGCNCEYCYGGEHAAAAIRAMGMPTSHDR